MSKRLLGSALLASGFTLVLLIAATMLASTSNQAQAVLASAPSHAIKPSLAPDAVWTDIAPFPTVTIDFTPTASSLKLKRAGAAAYPPNGKVYVLGGRHGADGQDISMRNIFEYTPGTPGSWVQKSGLLEPNGSNPGERWTANMAVAVLTDSSSNVRIYAIGGNNINSEVTSTVRIYNPVADSVSTLTTADWWPANPLHLPGGYAVYNNKLYIFGGFTGLGSGAVYSDTWVFDPTGAVGNKWRRITTANLSIARAYIAGAALDGKIYAIGGDTWNSSTRQLIPQTIVERFDPNNEAAGWTTVASLPTARGDMGAWAYDTGTGFEISGKIAVAGGVYPVPDAAGYLYDPNSDTWGSFASLNHATRNYAVAQMNGLLYAFGGYDYSAGFPDGANFNQRYDATGPVPTATNTPVSSPTSTSTPFNTNYSICTATATIEAGTTMITGSNCDDCLVNINLPFAFTLYDQSFTSARLSSNGSLGFVQADINPAATCLPDGAANFGIFGHWDDLTMTATGNGIYTSTTGTAPNRVFNIEWRAARTRTGTGTVNFEIRLLEGKTQFEIIYGTVPAGDTTATVGVQRDTGSLYSQFRCNGQAANLSNGLKLAFALGPSACPTITNTPAISNTPTNTSLPTNTFTPTFTRTATNTPIPTNTATNTPVPTDTPTATDTPTDTPTNTPVVQLTGHVTIQGRPAQPNPLQSVPVTLTLKLAGGGPESDYSTTTDASGNFAVTAPAPGTYDWRVKNPQTLANAGSTVLVPGSNTQEMGLLLQGDANNDNCDGALDFSILKNTFGKSVGDPGYDARADFNGDNTVTVSDFSLQKNNFGICGAGPILPGGR